MGDEDAKRGAEADAADIVRLAFAQAERLTAQAEEARREAEATLARAKAEVEQLLAAARTERDTLLADARRDRVAAEEALLRARAEAEREASDVMARASELARREAEILLDGSRMELLRARDEATEIRAAAERDAEAIVAAATQRARSTSAELLAATRRRLGTPGPAPASPATGAAGGSGDERSSSTPSSSSPSEPPTPNWGARLDLSEPSRPAPASGPQASMALVPYGEGSSLAVVGGAIVLEAAPEALVPPAPDGERAYRGVTNRTPQPADIDRLVESAVHRAVERAFTHHRRVRHRRS